MNQQTSVILRTHHPPPLLFLSIHHHSVYSTSTPPTRCQSLLIISIDNLYSPSKFPNSFLHKLSVTCSEYLLYTLTRNVTIQIWIRGMNSGPAPNTLKVLTSKLRNGDDLEGDGRRGGEKDGSDQVENGK